MQRPPAYHRPGMARFVVVSSVAALVLVAGCGKKSAEDTVLATVGNHTITAADYENRLLHTEKGGLPKDAAGEPVDTSTQSGKEAFLDQLVDRAVMVNRAEQLGLRNATDVVQAEKSFTDYYGVMAQYRDHIESKGDFVSDEELNAYYKRLQEARVCRVMVFDFSNDAEDARKRVLAGEDWAAVATDLGAGPKSSGHNTYRNKFRYGYLDDTFEAQIFGLQPGEVSPVFRNQYGYWIIRFDDAKPDQVQPLDEIRTAALEGIRNQKINLAKQAFLDELYDKYDYQVDETALWTVYQGLPKDEPKLDPQTHQPIDGNMLKPLDVPSDKLPDELFHYKKADGSVFTYLISDFKSSFDNQDSQQRPKRDMPLGMLRQSLDFDVSMALLSQEAKANHYMESADVRRDVEREIEDMLVNHLQDESVKVEDRVTPAAVDSFYAINADRLVNPETRNGHVVYCQDRDTAHQALEALHHGSSWAAVTRKFGTNPKNQEALGVIGEVPAGSVHPLGAILFALEGQGALSDPVQVGNAWAVVQLDTITPQHQLTKGEASQTIGQEIRRQRREAALRGLVAQWRSALKVETHPNQLKDLPSWDTLRNPPAPGNVVS